MSSNYGGPQEPLAPTVSTCKSHPSAGERAGGAGVPGTELQREAHSVTLDLS